MGFNVLKLIKDFNRRQQDDERDRFFEKLEREQDKSGPTREGVDVDQWRSLKRN